MGASTPSKFLLFFTVLASCGGEVEQSAACAAWVRCIDARDAQLGVSTDNLRFEVGGTCWTSAEQGEHCTPACERGLAWMRQAYADLPEECLP